MNFGEAVKRVYTHYCDFNGRARRSEFWYFVLFSLIVSLAIESIGVLTDNKSIEIILKSIFSLISFLPSLGVGVRRLHDIGKSGWSYLVIFIPIINILLLLWFARDSVQEANEYGPNPKASC